MARFSFPPFVYLSLSLVDIRMSLRFVGPELDFFWFWHHTAWYLYSGVWFVYFWKFCEGLSVCVVPLHISQYTTD